MSQPGAKAVLPLEVRGRFGLTGTSSLNGASGAGGGGVGGGGGGGGRANIRPSTRGGGRTPGEPSMELPPCEDALAGPACVLVDGRANCSFMRANMESNFALMSACALASASTSPANSVTVLELSSAMVGSVGEESRMTNRARNQMSNGTKQVKTE